MVELVDQVRRSCIWTCFGKKKGLVGKEFRALEVKGNVLDGCSGIAVVQLGCFQGNDDDDRKNHLPSKKY